MQSVGYTCHRAIGACNVVSIEARRLMDMVEPAWQYDVYHDVWEIMANEFELERRLSVLSLKVREEHVAATGVPAFAQGCPLLMAASWHVVLTTTSIFSDM